MLSQCKDAIDILQRDSREWSGAKNVSFAQVEKSELWRIFAPKNITYMWVPAHVGIQGHEKVDRLAKEATKKEHVDIKI